MDDLIQTEVLIIGSGIAGGVLALQLAEAGIPVMLVTRAREASDSNTYYAQGGIIYRGENDSAALLAEDIHRAGAGLCNPVGGHNFVGRRAAAGRKDPDAKGGRGRSTTNQMAGCRWGWRAVTPSRASCMPPTPPGAPSSWR